MSETVAGVGKANEWGKAEPAPAAGGRVWSFTIPVATPSVNALHQIIYSQRKVELKPEVLRWRSDASQHVPRIQLASKESVIRIDATFYYSFHYRNGNLRLFDTHNLMKCLIDLIAWKVGFNDNRVKSGSWNSVDAPEEKVEVTLRELL